MIFAVCSRVKLIIAIAFPELDIVSQEDDNDSSVDLTRFAATLDLFLLDSNSTISTHTVFHSRFHYSAFHMNIAQQMYLHDSTTDQQ